MKFRILILFAYLTIFNGCRRDPCSGVDQKAEENNYFLSENEKAIIPFIGNETLTFVTLFNDTSIFYGKGFQQDFNKESTTAGSIDCPKPISNNFEIKKLQFISNKLPALSIRFIKAKPNKIYPTTDIEITINQSFAINSLVYASDSTIVTDSISWIGGFQRGKILSGDLNVIYNSKIGILKFAFSDTIWTRIPNK